MSIMSIESIEPEKEVTKDNAKEIEEEIKGIYDKRVENFDILYRQSVLKNDENQKLPDDVIALTADNNITMKPKVSWF